MFTGDFSLGSEVLVDVNNQGGDDAEKQTETKNDSISNSKWKRSLSLGEERLLSFVHGEGRDDIISFVQVDESGNFRHGG